MADSVPMVVICGQVPTAAIGTRCVPGGAGRQHHGRGRQARVPGHRPRIASRPRCAPRSRSRAPAGPGPVVVDVPKDVQNWEGAFQATGRLPMPGYRQRHEPSSPATCSRTSELRRVLRDAGASRSARSSTRAAASSTAAPPTRCASSPQAFGIPVVTTLMGIGAVDTTHPLSLRMLGMHGAAFANYAVDDCDFLIARRLALRRPRRRRAREVRAATRSASRTSTSIASEINKVKRVQWSHVGPLAERCARCTSYGRRAALRRRLRRLARASRGAEARARDELRPRQPAHPAVLRDRGDQPPHARRGDHHHRRRPAPDVGGAVLRLPRAAPVAHLGQHGHDGLRPAGGDRRADRAAAIASSSTSTATPASA